MGGVGVGGKGGCVFENFHNKKKDMNGIYLKDCYDKSSMI